MKILIISGEVWHDGTNGGNVLSNTFAGMDAEFAQIYCNPGMPQNNICSRYYQITDSMVLHSFLRHLPIGKQFSVVPQQKSPTHNLPEKPNKRFYSFFHNHRLGVFYAARSILWNISNWKNEKLRQFVKEYNPDIIFAPCYGDVFMLRLTRYIEALTGKRIISYISDDSYTLNQFSLSPYFWISRFLVRHQLRKTFPYYSLVYTMTETQKKQCERDFHANMKILLKSVNLTDIIVKKTVSDPIKIIYAGGIYLNRWQTLAALSLAISEINLEYGRMCYQLDIYTGNEISSAINKGFSNNGTMLHAAVSQSELKKQYEKSDIALHVESFDLRNRLAVRMSFSTKITDCLGSGCAVMAICDSKQGGYRYLEDNDAAICISDLKMIKSKLQEIIDNPEQLLQYAAKARQLCIRNHDADRIHAMIKKDFEDVLDRE